MDKTAQLSSQHDQPAISPRAELSAAIGFGLFSPILIDLPIAALLTPHGGNSHVVLACILSAAAMAKFGGLAVWLAWGQSQMVWRLPIALSSIFLSVIIWTRGYDWKDSMPTTLFLVLGVSAISAIPRVFGAARINLYDKPGSTTAQPTRRVQFRLTDLFAWTATVAVLTGIFRWVGFPDGFEWLPVIFVMPIAGVLVLTAMWATLTLGHLISLRVGISLLLTLGIGTVLAAMTGGQAEAAMIIFSTMLMTMALLLGVLYVVRQLGIRLVFGRSRVLIAPVGIGTNTLHTSKTLNETSPGVATPGLE